VATLDTDMKVIVEGTILCFAATTNPDGSPNLSPKSSLRVHDDARVAWVEDTETPHPQCASGLAAMSIARLLRDRGERSLRSAGSYLRLYHRRP